MEQTFEVGAAPRLTVSNFAGSVIVRPGDSGAVHVVATKRARSAADLDRIEVEMIGEACCVQIKASHPTLATIRDASVKIEITVPAEGSIDLLRR